MTLHLQELNFSLFVKSFNPTIFNFNTLHHGGIIQPDWKLAEKPIYSDYGVKLVFTNKIRIIAQANRLVFAETIGEKSLNEVLLPSIVKRNLQIFSDLEYQAISLNPSGYAPFESGLDAAKYLSEGLLASDSWGTFNEQGISAVGLKLAYPYKTGKFYLDVNQASVMVSNLETSAVWFAGNFNYQLLEETLTQRKQSLVSILDNWQSDITNFKNFIDSKFLSVTNRTPVSLFHL